MPRRIRIYSVIALILVAAVSIGAFALARPFATHATPSTGRTFDGVPRAHDLKSPLSAARRAARQEVLKEQAQGTAQLGGKQGKGTVYKTKTGKFVELDRESEDSIWTVIGEFGTTVSPTYGGTAGPLHNQIPEPNRANDNTTIWTENFDQQHFKDLLFSEAPGANSMRNFYIENSSGRYAVNGDVTDWTKVSHNEAYYGSDYCGDIVCARTWLFVQESVNNWYNGAVAAKVAAGKTTAQAEAEVNSYLSQFDQWDRYDYNGDGNFDQPDGYIDHFQSIHAGEGEETGGGAQGDDAIWSHRWYAFYNLIGSAGPASNLMGGIHIGNSPYWIGDYTIEPENGGSGVFSHEFGHDLDLPDEYDTAGNTCGSACENDTGWWTIMSQGSYGTQNNIDLGTAPVQFSAWDKLNLGWLNYDVAYAGKHSEHKLGPAEGNTKDAQALITVLPDKQVTSTIGTPFAGSKFYYSGTNNNLDTLMRKAVTVPAGASVTAKVRYNTEQDWDYAYLVVSTDGGASWTNVHTNLSTNTNPNGNNLGEGITGVSTGGGWVNLTATLPASGNVLVGFRYKTDPAQQGQPGAPYQPGFALDEISIAGGAADGAETDGGWTFSPASGGFHATTGSETQSFFNAYIAEFRQYRGFDRGLQTGPYNFGFLDNGDKQNWVEHFPYQDGLLIWYWDTSQADDNTSAHPGAGLILPIDSHPDPLMRPDGNPWRPRVQSYDAPFSLEATDAITLHQNSNAKSYPSLPGVSVFDDANSYWNAAIPTSSVKVPHTGTKIRIQGVNANGFIQVRVN